MNTYINGTGAVEFEQLSIIKDISDPAELRAARAEKAAILKERAVTDGTFDTMSDADTLAVILSTARGGCDPYVLAGSLLESFGSLKGVFEARPEQLRSVRGMNESRVQQIGLVKPLVRLWNRLNMETPARIGNSREAERYCLSIGAGERTERFFVVALNAQCQILGRRCISTGSLSEVSAYPRLVMETALNYNAHSVLLSHNHPGGTCAPSPEDITSTIKIQRLLNEVSILVLDHIIVAGDNTYSMIQHGDIDYRVRGSR